MAVRLGEEVVADMPLLLLLLLLLLFLLLGEVLRGEVLWDGEDWLRSLL